MAVSQNHDTGKQNRIVVFRIKMPSCKVGDKSKKISNTLHSHPVARSPGNIAQSFVPLISQNQHLSLSLQTLTYSDYSLNGSSVGCRPPYTSFIHHHISPHTLHHCTLAAQKRNGLLSILPSLTSSFLSLFSALQWEVVKISCCMSRELCLFFFARQQGCVCAEVNMCTRVYTRVGWMCRMCMCRLIIQPFGHMCVYVPLCVNRPHE